MHSGLSVMLLQTEKETTDKVCLVTFQNVGKTPREMCSFVIKSEEVLKIEFFFEQIVFLCVRL